MSVSYDLFTDAFLSKVTAYDFPETYEDKTETVDGFMRRAIASFSSVCKYDLEKVSDNEERVFHVDIAPEDLDEILEIVSEGMLVQWMKPYVYRQQNLENVLNTRDFTTYSPAELLLRITGAYTSVQKDFTNMMREYSFRHGDIGAFHL